VQVKSLQSAGFVATGHNYTAASAILRPSKQGPHSIESVGLSGPGPLVRAGTWFFADGSASYFYQLSPASAPVFVNLGTDGTYPIDVQLSVGRHLVNHRYRPFVTVSMYLDVIEPPVGITRTFDYTSVYADHTYFTVDRDMTACGSARQTLQPFTDFGSVEFQGMSVTAPGLTDSDLQSVPHHNVTLVDIGYRKILANSALEQSTVHFVAASPQEVTSCVPQHDFTADGHSDVIVRAPNGNLNVFPGDGHGGFASGAVPIGVGWNAYDTIVSAGDWNGDGPTDLIARKPDGTLWLYPGGGGRKAAKQIGNGWQIFDTIVALPDFDGDGHADLLARKPDGTLWLYPGNGTGGFATHTQIGNGWQMFDRIIGVPDFNGDHYADVIARKPDGSLWLYRGNGAGRFSAGPYAQIGSGWQVFNTIVAVDDFDGDGHTDLIGRKPDGTLWLYRGNGAGGFLPGPYPQIASGWGNFTAIL
jgi:hypothetical protein